jgi:predicted DNA-binding transcriptional regulator AlpA
MQATSPLPGAPALDDDPVLPPWQAGPRVGLAPSTLAKMRMDGRGPRFIRLSATRVAYRLSALNAWLAERERESTLEDRAGQA